MCMLTVLSSVRKANENAYIGELIVKILVVGAGLSGAVVAREFANHGVSVNVIDKRSHIAGNAYDYLNDHDIRVHAYGPHLFHTSNQKVVDWLSQFTQWHPYKHRVKALLSDGTYVTLPVNRETKRIIGSDNLVDVLVRPYTEKMWGLSLEEVDPTIPARVPVRDDMNEYYFPTDTFQALPSLGYTEMVKNILSHHLIQVELNKPFQKEMEHNFYHVFNSMAIDEYFGYKFGELPYRSLRFHNVSLPVPRIFPAPQINFTHTERYTRATEWKLLPGHGVNPAFTSITVEEPCDYRLNNLERYYPIKDKKGVNQIVYDQYAKESRPNCTFIGRCGQYMYLDMHQVISSTLSIVKSKLHEFGIYSKIR